MSPASDATAPGDSSNGGAGPIGNGNGSAAAPHGAQVSRLVRRGAGGTRVAVLCTNEVVRQGIIALLPEEWQEQTAIAATALQLEQTIGDSCVGSIIDADASDAGDAARATRERGGAVVVLVDSAAHRLEPWIVEDADAILVRDNVDQLLLRMALVARRVGMRLVPRSLPPSLSEPSSETGPPLSDQARHALVLLADGRRYAEMAHELNLSESAVRKLVQRTMHGMGARTRCQAIAIAARAGQLD